MLSATRLYSLWCACFRIIAGTLPCVSTAVNSCSYHPKYYKASTTSRPGSPSASSALSLHLGLNWARNCWLTSTFPLCSSTRPYSATPHPAFVTACAAQAASLKGIADESLCLKPGQVFVQIQEPMPERVHGEDAVPVLPPARIIVGYVMLVKNPAYATGDVCRPLCRGGIGGYIEPERLRKRLRALRFDADPRC